jgi:hypothetical protein
MSALLHLEDPHLLHEHLPDSVLGYEDLGRLHGRPRQMSSVCLSGAAGGRAVD